MKIRKIPAILIVLPFFLLGMYLSYGLLYLLLLYHSYTLIIVSNNSFIVNHLKASFGISYGADSEVGLLQ